ncbi:MAG: transposase [Mycoplasmataceae bacterium]|nr:transposase [Mycoplasmataceae bacterium]
MLRTYKLKHSINQGKQQKILNLLEEYRKVSAEISSRQWRYFYENGRFNRDFEIDSIKSELSKRYRQTAQYQVVAGLESYLGNRQNEFKAYLKNSNFDKETKIKLYYINRYKKWFYQSVKMQNREIEQDIIKLSRKIIKNIFKKNKKPNFNFCNMALDAKVMEITPNGIKKVQKSKQLKDEDGELILNRSENPKLKTYIEEQEIKRTSYDYWIKLSTLEKGKKIYLPLTTNDYFEGIKGEINNFIQINFQQNIEKIDGNVPLSTLGRIDYGNYKINLCLIKNIKKEKYQPEIDKLALDLGLNNLFATNIGELYGRNFSKLLKKYDEIVSLLAKNRQKQRVKTLSKKYKKLINKIKAYLKNEINRVINNLIKNNQPKEIVVERLNFTSPKLSKKLNRMLSNFGKRIIEEKFESIEEKYGIVITQINPAYTSQECSKCGYVEKKNRKSQAKFICGFCGKKQNADINSSKNILARSSSSLKDIFAKRAFILDNWCYDNPKTKIP